MTVKQIPSKISALFIDWDGTITQRYRTPIQKIPLHSIPSFLEALNIIEHNRGTRHAVSTNVTDLIDKYTLNTPVRARQSPIRKLITSAEENSIPWVIVSDHDTLKKSKALDLIQPLGQVCCRHYALKPLVDALYAALCMVNCPHYEVLFIGDRFDTDGEMCAKIGMAYMPITDLNHVKVDDVIKRMQINQTTSVFK